MSDVSPIPPGCNTVNVYLIVPNAQEAAAFYEKAFGAELVSRMAGPDGESTMHAELRIGNSTIMLTDENPEWQMKSAQTLGGSPASLHLYVEDVDAIFQQAIEAGCTVLQPVQVAFWGDRYGKVSDPFGFHWGIATHVEDVPPDELEKRAQEFMVQMSQSRPPEEAE